jgi:hypothetical protein
VVGASRRAGRGGAAWSSEVLEQLVTRQVLALLDDAGEPAVGDGHDVIDPALAAEAELQLRSFCTPQV